MNTDVYTLVVDVGIRELRGNLSAYLDRVRRGEELVVTDRGSAVARIVPIDGGRALDRLVAEGLVTPAATTNRTPLQAPVTAKGTVSDLVAEQRR